MRSWICFRTQNVWEKYERKKVKGRISIRSSTEKRRIQKRRERIQKVKGVFRGERMLITGKEVKGMTKSESECKRRLGRRKGNKMQK